MSDGDSGATPRFEMFEPGEEPRFLKPLDYRLYAGEPELVITLSASECEDEDWVDPPSTGTRQRPCATGPWVVKSSVVPSGYQSISPSSNPSGMSTRCVSPVSIRRTNNPLPSAKAR